MTVLLKLPLRGVRITIVFILATFILLPSQRVQSQPQDVLYAYLELSGDGSGIVRAVDPANPGTATDILTISGSAENTVANAYLSPTGEWLLVRFDGTAGSSLRLYNLQTSEAVDVVTEFAPAQRPLTLSPANSPQHVAWSPDGNYVAVSYRAGAEGQGIYLYDVSLHSLSDLKPANINQYQLAWDSTSSHLATFGLTCDVNSCSRASLDVFDASSVTVFDSYDLGSLATGAAGQSTVFCELAWSPDGQWFSFVRQCDGSALGSPREVYAVNSATGAPIQLTTLTPTDVPPANSLFVASINTVWLDADTVLVSFDSQDSQLQTDANGNITEVLPGTFRTSTLSISIGTAQSHVVTDKRLDDLTATSRDLLGYVFYTYNNETMVVTDAAVEIARYQGQSRNTIARGPAGCNLQWNQDATILAFAAQDAGSRHLCERTNTVYFLSESGGLQSHAIDSGVGIALGWL